MNNPVLGVHHAAEAVNAVFFTDGYDPSQQDFAEADALPVIADRDGQVRQGVIGIKGIARSGNDRILTLFRNHGHQGEFTAVINVCKVSKHVVREVGKASEKAEIKGFRGYFAE